MVIKPNAIEIMHVDACRHLLFAKKKFVIFGQFIKYRHYGNVLHNRNKK